MSVNHLSLFSQTMDEISTLENDIKGIKEAIDAKNAPMMVSYCCSFPGFSLLVFLHMVNGWGHFV